jgi:hypothetical protein
MTPSANYSSFAAMIQKPQPRTMQQLPQIDSA